MRLRRGRPALWAASAAAAAAAVLLFDPGGTYGAVEALSRRVADYTIEASLDPAGRRVAGRQRLVWRNPAAVPATELRFHLYLNAFSNNRTTFMREFLASRGAGALDRWRDGWGGIAVDSLRLGGEEMVERLEFVHPDDPNPDDRTVARLPLAVAVPAGGSVELDIVFTARLPKLLVRTGYHGDFHLVGQWFPKLGVFADGEWSCHQFHAASEFFADFGTYDVRLTVPRDYTVGATGVLQEERDNGDGTRTLHYLAEDVHDFAWTADPALRERRHVHRGIELILLCHERDCRSQERFFGALRHAIDWFADHIGAYPYPVLTTVVPPPFASAAGGMEYPMFITAVSPRWVPSRLRLPELVTIHEFGHQYWHGMVASNEAREAWLDEGVNSYTEGKIMSVAYGAGRNLLDLGSLRLGANEARRGVFMSFGGRDPATLPAWEFLDQRSYVAVVYDKTALALETLEGYIGEEAVLTGLRRYFDRWRFRHPHGEDFFEALEDTVGFDLDWFFEQTLRAGSEVDYAVTRIRMAKVPPLAGLDIPPQPAAPADLYESTVVLERLGDARLPVDVKVVFDDGSEARERWDGQARWRRLDYRGTHAVAHAVLDPDGRMPLDVNPLNDSRMRDPATRGLVRLGLRWGFWFQNLLHLLTSF